MENLLHFGDNTPEVTKIKQIVKQIHFEVKKEEIRKDVVFVKSSRIELRPWDMHSDISFIFIPIFGFISIVLILIKYIILIKEKIGKN